MTNQDYEALYQALKMMVSVTDLHSKELSNHKKWVSPKVWAKDWRTIKFQLARQMGHTTMGLRLVKELNRDTLYLVLHGMMGYIEDMAPKMYNLTIRDDSYTFNEGVSPKLVIIDYEISSKRLNILYEAFKEYDPIYVLLGGG